MLALANLSRDVLRSLREHLRPLVAYHLFFTVLASSLLLPAVAWSLAHLVGRFGRTVISNAELIDLLVSPAGTLWLLAATGLSFLVLYLQQAGMILVAARPRDHHLRLAFEALWWTLHRLPALAGLVVVQVGTHLLLVLPVAFVLVWLHGALLGGLDPTMFSASGRRRCGSSSPWPCRWWPPGRGSPPPSMSAGSWPCRWWRWRHSRRAGHWPVASSSPAVTVVPSPWSPSPCWRRS